MVESPLDIMLKSIISHIIFEVVNRAKTRGKSPSIILSIRGIDEQAIVLRINTESASTNNSIIESTNTDINAPLKNLFSKSLIIPFIFMGDHVQRAICYMEKS